jgi:hypothetical protein
MGGDEVSEGADYCRREGARGVGEEVGVGVAVEFIPCG